MYVCTQLFLPVDVQVLHLHLLKRLFPPLNYFCAFVKKQLGTAVWVCFWALCSILLIYVPILSSTNTAVLITVATE